MTGVHALALLMSLRCPLLRRFLLHSSAAHLKNIHLQTWGRSSSGSKQTLADAIVEYISDDTRGEQVSEVLGLFTKAFLRDFLRSEGKLKGVPSGASKADVVDTFVGHDILEEGGATGGATSSTFSREATMNGSPAQDPNAVAITTLVVWTPASQVHAPSPDLSSQLVADDGRLRRRMRKRLHRQWGKLARAMHRKTNSSKIRRAIRAVCSDETLTLDEIREQVERHSGVLLSVAHRKAYAFFQKKVQEQLAPPKPKRQRRRTLVFADPATCNPFLEARERALMQYEDSLSRLAFVM